MIYPPPADPHKLMECVDWMDEDLLKSITKKYWDWLRLQFLFFEIVTCSCALIQVGW